VPPVGRVIIKDATEYFFNDQKEGKPWDEIEEGKKRERGMLASFMKMMKFSEDVPNH
jgi:hypothetical protein